MRSSPQSVPALRDPGRRRRSAQLGVTLVEAMTTTAISAILLGVGVPSFVDRVQATRTRSEAQELWALLNRARAEAVRRNVPVLVCPSRDGASCLSLPSAASWSGTKIACSDADGNGACDDSTPNAPNPIQVRQATDASVRIAGPEAVVRFNGHGTAGSRASFTLSAAVGEANSSTVEVAAIGAVKVE